LSLPAPKTKDFAAILKALNLAGTTTLVATAALDQNVVKSARNIQKVSISPVGELNALAVLAPKKLLVTKAALDAIAAAAEKAAKKPN
jgi:large subunit ribosomal protein L4